ncbi:hypothetical protein N0V82_009103 [Gnomoniopsis sp. IMI 355080]|nr:hypothetical protein N0V82_009103 [Gnomoniopsis sp. IMI 355080]
MTQSLAEGLCAISERVDEAGRDLSLSRTDEMKRVVADLYEHIFLFLNGVMDWILQKSFRRLLDSFADDFNDRFQSEISKIDKKAERVRIFASQSSRAEVRVTRLVTEELSRDVRLGLDGQQRFEAEWMLHAERMEKQASKVAENTRLQVDHMRLLSEAVKVLLHADAVKWLTSQTASKPAPSLDHPSTATGFIATIEDLVMNSRHLEDFFSRDRVRMPADVFGITSLGQEPVMRIQEWSQGLGSRLLWLEGPVLELDEFENPLTGFASKFIHLAENYHLSVVSYFCELPRHVTEKHGPEQSAAISLLYALLRQMIENLPPCLETTVDFSEERFSGLDGTMKTWSEATALFRDVLSVVSGTVFCVIDGLHWLDSRSTDAPLADLLQVLRNDHLRILFTTTGRSGCLLEDLGREETCSLQDFHLSHSNQDLEWELASDDE